MTSTTNNSGKDVHVAEANPNGNNLVLTTVSSDELSDTDLAAVAAGNVVLLAYQAWFTCLKSCADSKGQVQMELARFR